MKSGIKEDFPLSIQVGDPPQKQLKSNKQSSKGADSKNKQNVKKETSISSKVQYEQLQMNLEKYAKLFDNKQNENSEQFAPDSLEDSQIKKLQFKYQSKNSIPSASSPCHSSTNIVNQEISIIQPASKQNVSDSSKKILPSDMYFTQNKDSSVASVPKNLLDDIQKEKNSMFYNNNQTLFFHRKTSLSKLEMLNSISKDKQNMNELQDQNLSIKTKSAASLMSISNKIHLRNISNNNDISYLKEFHQAGQIDPSVLTSSLLTKNPVNPIYSSYEQTKQNIYAQMYDHTHNKDKFDTDFSSIKKKIEQEDLLKKVTSRRYNDTTQQIQQQSGLNALNSTINKTLDPLNISSQKKQNMKLLLNISNNSKTQDSQKVYFARQLNSTYSLNNTMNQSVTNSSNRDLSNSALSLLTKPTNRQEVVELEKWLDEMIGQLEIKTSMTLADVFEQIEVIYTACIRELVRQITVQCKVRGQLLQRVWDSYLDILKKGIESNSEQKDNEEKEHLDEISRIHKMYEQTIKMLEVKFESQTKQNEELSSETRMLTNTIHYFRKRLLVQQEEMKAMHKMEEELRAELEAALTQNLQLKLMQGDSSKHNDSVQISHENSKQQSSTRDIPQEDYQDSHKHLQQEESDTKTSDHRRDNKNKISVVSHLINYNKKQMYDDGEVETQKKKIIEEKTEQEIDSDDSAIFAEKEVSKDNFNSVIDAEKKQDDVHLHEINNKFMDIQLLDIAEKGEQTDQIQMSESSQVNQLIYLLTSNQLLEKQDPDLLSQYQQCNSIIRQSTIDISDKETLLQAINSCKMQLAAYNQMGITTQQIQEENVELKKMIAEKNILLEEQQQHYEDKKRRWKIKANYYLEQLKNLDENLILQSSSNQSQFLTDLKLKKKMQTAIRSFLNLKNKSKNNLDKQLLQQQSIKNEFQGIANDDPLGNNNIMSLEEQQIQEDFQSGKEEQLDEDTLLNLQQEQLELQQEQGDEVNSLQNAYLNLEKEFHESNPSRPSGQKLMKVLSQIISEDYSMFGTLQKNQLGADKNPHISVLSLRSEFEQSHHPRPSIAQPIIPPAFKSRLNKRIYSQNTALVNKLVENISKKKKSSKIPLVPLASLNIFYSRIFEEILKNEKSNKVPLSVYCFDILLQKYGLQQIAEAKIQKILKSTLHFQGNNPKIEIISKFLGLRDKFEEIDYVHFLDALKHFQKDYPNILSDSENQILIPTEKAREFLVSYYGNKLDKEGIQKLMAELNGASYQSEGIQFGELTKKCTKYFEEKRNKVKLHIEDIFYATDLDSNESVEFFEFDLMFRYIEKEMYNLQSVENIFFEEADLIVPLTGEKALSFNKFITLSVQRGLFNFEKCQTFLKSPLDEGAALNLEDLIKRSQEIKKAMKNRFVQAGKFMADIKHIIKTLFIRINEANPPRPNSIWISYKIMEFESRRLLLDHEAKSIISEILPIRLLMLSIVARKFEEII